MENIVTYEIGYARLHVLNMGTLQFKLNELIAVPEGEEPGEDAASLDQTVQLPVYTVVIKCDGTCIVVDPFRGDSVVGTPYAHPGYAPPPPLTACLADAGTQLHAVEHVVITHWHWDHCTGVMCSDEEDALPLFPKARHYLGRADWADARQSYARGASKEYVWLGKLRQAGLLELVSGALDLSPSVSLLPAPGESPGHQIVRVRSGGACAYIIGDLFHHEIEVAHPSWMSTWNWPERNIASRASIVKAAMDDDALIIPGHFAPGRLVKAASGVAWRSADAD
jgi:glyoxylase-like metal-dependent hydrolase (beta-lactamase superfamily II)